MAWLQRLGGKLDTSHFIQPSYTPEVSAPSSKEEARDRG